MPTVTVNGVSTYYEIHGGGSPVLYIHGGFGGSPGDQTESGSRAIEALAGVAQVVIYHRRNSGRSEYSIASYALPDLAADARALMNSLGIDRSVVVGSSMGGMVALQYALDYPESISALALVNTGPALMASTGFGPPMARVVERAAHEGDRSLFESRKDRLRTPPELQGVANTQNHSDRLDVLARLSEDELFMLSTGAIRNYGAFIGFDYVDRLTELKMPVVILHGDADPVVSFENAGALKSGITHAELIVIDGAEHGVLSYKEAQDALRNWVESVT